jgi:pyruvate/2-oxoacid:ferredoxin oxidoreductase beta subunit
MGIICETCKVRKEKNILRIFDCKNETCKAAYTTAPKITDVMCTACDSEWKSLQGFLTNLNIAFVHDPYIVRGLDYYIGTAFEFVSNDLGAQATFCGGGRYELAQTLGSRTPVPSLGAGIGMGRLMMLFDTVAHKHTLPQAPKLHVILPFDTAYHATALQLTNRLQVAGFCTDLLVDSTSAKTLLKKANKMNADLLGAFREWIDGKEDAEKSKAATDKLLPLLEKESDPLAKDLIDLKQYLIKKSVWVIGGDGWAYDIGYGGLDHVLASGADINLLVLDTEVYSNTGGQSSKSTPVGAVAKFAASGKKVGKKDLGAMAMTYGYVYVAQVAMGANNSQLFRALKEAEAYPGPSIVIAYSPCINHGLKLGMGKTQEEMDRAVNAGYWNLFRYNPVLGKEGKNPFLLDSKEPDWSKFQEFINSEVRYTSLQKMFPAEAEVLFKAAEENARWRYMNYKRLSELDYSK